MANAIITLAVEVDHGERANELRRDLAIEAESRPGIHVRESHVAVDQSLVAEDVDE